MGRMSDLMIDLMQEAADNLKRDWIRRELNDLEADEDTPGWGELSEKYDSYYEDLEEYYESEYEWHREQNHSSAFIEFSRAIESIKNVLDSHLNPRIIDTVFKMLYVNTVTAMETYLGDSIKSTVLNEKKYIVNAVKNLTELAQQKFKLEEFVNDEKFAEKVVIEQLNKYLYHDITRVLMIYRAVLGFNFNYDISSLIEISKLRHDLVHRNGRSIEGVLVYINLDSINQCITEIESFIKHIEAELTKHLS